jgi:putative redox protein
MQIRIEHLNHGKFAATVRGHRIVCDQPPSNGGNDEGPTPPEFLLISLGTCAGFYAASYMKNHGLNLSLGVSVDAEKVPAPARLGKFRVEIECPDLPPEHEAGLLRSVNACLIKNTLLQAPVIETVLNHALVGA